jgi:hypothetical protein
MGPAKESDMRSGGEVQSRQAEESWCAGRDETRRLEQGRSGILVRVQAGCLLVTREGDPDDHVLGPGDALLVQGPGLAVAWALKPSRATLGGPGPGAARPAARLAA